MSILMQNLKDRAYSIKNDFVRQLKTTVNFLVYMFELRRRKDIRKSKKHMLNKLEGCRILEEQKVLKNYGKIDRQGKDKLFEQLLHPDIVI